MITKFCEHYVNSRIYGLNYSKQVEERPTKTSENAHRQGFLIEHQNAMNVDRGELTTEKAVFLI